MSTAEIKQHVIERIQSLEDDNILQEIENLLAFYDDDEVIVFTDEQKARIEQGLKDYENGDYISNEQANKEAEEWLRK